jgi:hypothetical protein
MRADRVRHERNRVDGRDKPGHDGPWRVGRTYSRAPAARKALRLAPRPQKPPSDLDDNERYQPAEQHVGQIMAAEGRPQ